MLFLFIVMIAYLIFMGFLVNRKSKRILSVGSLVLLLFSVIINISLAQNYTQSLIKEANDGIGISNTLAYWIITDDGWGRFWSSELFKTFYEISTNISILLLIILCISLIVESKKANKLR